MCVCVLCQIFYTRSGVTALQFCGPLTLGVGTTLGQVLLYDIRSTRPYQCKDHHYNQPIHTIMFQNNEEEDLVLSADKKALRIWKQQTVCFICLIDT